MYGNKSIKKRKDGSNYKDFYYYGCKHRNMTRGHKCDYKKQVHEEMLDALKNIKKDFEFHQFVKSEEMKSEKILGFDYQDVDNIIYEFNVNNYFSSLKIK